MASSLNEVNLEKKLNSVTNTQESIQTLSLWCIHHRAHSKKIVEVWLKVLRKAKSSHRLALFYLANDVIQNSKRKGNSVFADAWNTVLKDAIPFARDEKIKSQIERIFTIWESRNIFETEFINDLKTILGNHKTVTTTKSRGAANAKLLAEFKPQKLIDKIRKNKKVENESELKQKQLSSMKIDVSSSETLRQLKDRAHGDKFSKEFEDSTNKLSEYVQYLEQEVQERTGLIQMLEKGETFYDTQRGEAKIVANAYKNFGSRVKNLKKKLDDLKSTLPSPIPSPTPDAPSPVDSSVGGSPPQNTNQDNTEAVDMEMSDDEVEGCTLRLEDPDAGSPGSAPSPEGSPVGLNLPTASPKEREKEARSSLTVPITTGHNIMTSLLDSVSGSVPALTNKSSLDSRLSNLMQNIPSLSPAMHSGLFDDSPGLIPLPHSVASPSVNDSGNEGGGTPLKDEGSATGSATPLQDEEREMDLPSKNSKDNSENLSISEFLKKIGSSFSSAQQPAAASERDWNFTKPSEPHAKRPSQHASFQTSSQFYSKGAPPVGPLHPFESYETSSSNKTISRINSQSAASPAKDVVPNSGAFSYDPKMPLTPVDSSDASCQNMPSSMKQNNLLAMGSLLLDSADGVSTDIGSSFSCPSRLRNVPGSSVEDSLCTINEPPFAFRKHANSESSLESYPDDLGNSRDLDSLPPPPRKIGLKRNTNIVELTPCPTRTGAFKKDDGELRMNSNLITLVQSTDDANAKVAFHGKSVNLEHGRYNYEYQPPTAASGRTSFPANMHHLQQQQQQQPMEIDTDASLVQNDKLAPSQSSMLEMKKGSNIGGAISSDGDAEPLSQVTNVSVNAEFHDVSSKHASSASEAAPGSETTFSRIETVGSRRDVLDKRKYPNESDLYNRRFELYERRTDRDQYPPPQGHRFTQLYNDNWEARGYAPPFPHPRPRFGPMHGKRYPPPPHHPHPDGRRPYYASRH